MPSEHYAALRVMILPTFTNGLVQTLPNLFANTTVLFPLKC